MEKNQKPFTTFAKISILELEYALELASKVKMLYFRFNLSIKRNR